MNGSLRPTVERLYLQKDEDDEIFVDSMLHQHHIDGVRFLFKQFKKKKSGVIINNPLGYGNSLQVALFLGAIRHLLKNPILIVCEQSEELNWLDHFQKLTQCYNVAVAAPNPFVKKSIFINTLENIEIFCRRDWSVMVIDDEAFLKEKTLQTKFKADYKIWITPVDMKENLKTFSLIYKWLCPKGKFNIEDFQVKPSLPKDILRKSILLEASLQDIVCRTTLLTPFENPYGTTVDTPLRTSKKNKDATGTKIKRSKRSFDEMNTLSQSISASGSSGKVPKLGNKHLNEDSNDFNVESASNNEKDDAEGEAIDSDGKHSDDIESFIKNKDPIKYDAYKEYIQEFDNISNNSQEKTELDDETDTNLAIINDVDPDMNIADNPGNYCLDSDSDGVMPKSDGFLHEETKSQDSNDCVYNLKTLNFLVLNPSNEAESDDELRYDTDRQTLEAEENRPDDIESDKSDIEIEIDPEISIDNIGTIAKKRKLEDEASSDEKVNENNKNAVETEICQTKDTSKPNNIDTKVTEQVELAFKKFKGTFLDSIF